MEKLSKPTWVTMKESEVKTLIAELAEKNSPSQVGIILRDQYAIPSTKIFGKKLKSYYTELGIDHNEDLINAENKVEKMQDHLKNNVTDRKAKHKFQKAQAKLNKVRKYYGIVKRKK